MESYIFIAIILVCILIIAISFIRHKVEIVINFILRIVAGIVGIYFVNILLIKMGYQLAVGINGLSTIIVGVLGLPGFLLNYSIAFYYMLTK